MKILRLKGIIKHVTMATKYVFDFLKLLLCHYQTFSSKFGSIFGKSEMKEISGFMIHIR